MSLNIGILYKLWNEGKKNFYQHIFIIAFLINLLYDRSINKYL